MDVVPLAIPEVKLIRARRWQDDRGGLVETWSRDRFAEHGLVAEFVQENHVYNGAASIVRGLHFQLPPMAQAKLVRCVRGAVFDVALDVRRRSPSFGRHVAVELRAGDDCQLLIPPGFAHGYCTLEPDSEVVYLLSAPYAPATERAVLWCDPALAIAWPCAPARAIVSPKDQAAPSLAAAPDLFD